MSRSTTSDAPPAGDESPREARRSEVAELARQQLLDAAEAAFSERGYHAATLKAIAEAAEFSVGSVYSFFANKDDLFISVFLRRGDELVPAMRAVATGDDDPLAQLHDLVDLEVGFFRRHANFGRLYLRTSSTTVLSPEREVDEAMRSRFVEAMDLHAEVIRRGQAAGVIRPGAPRALARMLAGMVSAFQAADPEVMGDDVGDDGEVLDLDDLHAMVAAAFGAPGTRTTSTGGER